MGTHSNANDGADFFTYSRTIRNANKRAQFFTQSNANERPDFFADKYAYP